MTYKKLIAGFGCKNGQAIILDSNQMGRSYDVLALGRYYSDNGADAIRYQFFWNHRLPSVY